MNLDKLSSFSNLEYLVIISHYDHDISWTQKLTLPYQIYYKDQPDKEPFQAPNKAKSESNIIKFCWEFYDHLPENIIFVHQYEYKSTHQGSLVDILNSSELLEKYQKSKTPGYYNFNQVKMGDIYPQYEVIQKSGWWHYCMSSHFAPIQRYHNFTKNKGGCSQFIVSRERIQSLGKSFYHNMYHWLITQTVEGMGDKNSETLQRDIIESDKHPRSNYYTSRFLEWTYELIFATYKLYEKDYYTVSIPIKKQRMIEKKDNVIIPEKVEEKVEEKELDLENIKLDIDTEKQMETYTEDLEYEILAIYGYDYYYVNVTHLFLDKFRKDHEIMIDKNENLDLVFSDYVPGKVKNLKIDIRGKGTWQINNKRTEDFKVDLSH